MMSDFNYIKFLKHIQKEMSERDLTLRTAANEIGVDHVTLHRIINGKRPKLDNAIKIAKWLKTPIENFVK